MTIFGWLCSGLGAAVLLIHNLNEHTDHIDLYIGAGCIFFGAYLIQNGDVSALLSKLLDKLPLLKKGP